MLQGAIFDMDGLLLDTERVYQVCWLETARAFGQEENQEFPLAVSGSNGDSMLRIVHQYYPAVDAPAFVADCFARVFAVLDRDGPRVKPGVREILAYLRSRGVKTAVASSSGTDRVRANLRRVDLPGLFDAVVSGQEVERNKPAPDIFLLAAEQIGCAPASCWVFEDSLNGIRAALAAGCVPVMIPDITPPPEHPEGFTVCKSLLEALDRIQAGTL